MTKGTRITQHKPGRARVIRSHCSVCPPSCVIQERSADRRTRMLVIHRLSPLQPTAESTTLCPTREICDQRPVTALLNHVIAVLVGAILEQCLDARSRRRLRLRLPLLHCSSRFCNALRSAPHGHRRWPPHPFLESSLFPRPTRVDFHEQRFRVLTLDTEHVSYEGHEVEKEQGEGGGERPMTNSRCAFCLLPLAPSVVIVCQLSLVGQTLVSWRRPYVARFEGKTQRTDLVARAAPSNRARSSPGFLRFALTKHTASGAHVIAQGRRQRTRQRQGVQRRPYLPRRHVPTYAAPAGSLKARATLEHAARGRFQSRLQPLRTQAAAAGGR